MKKLLIIFILFSSLVAQGQTINDLGQVIVTINKSNFDNRFIATKFCYPVNHGVMDGYYDAFPFQVYSKFMGGLHQGADISKPGDPNIDLGDTIYCIANGRIVYAHNDIIMVLHKTNSLFVVSLYRHCMELFVIDSEYVKCTQPIGRIGNCDGVYSAHLHFEIRTDLSIGIGTGYGTAKGYLNPMQYLESMIH